MVNDASVQPIVGRSPKFLAALDLAKRAAPSHATILLSGDSGTGKEVFAKFIHRHSHCANGPFVTINCSAIPENLLESELFGHARGSFTGAIDKKIGLFEEAQNGTLFLDEIGDLSLTLQAKLLRVLQEKQIRRVGENQNRSVNCRIISATHKNLLSEIKEKRFREDLFFRLDVIPIFLPPLRERSEDLIPLAESFLKKYSVSNCTPLRSFAQDAVEYILNNPWRGNVRELENAIERALILCDKTEITAAEFTPIQSAQDPEFKPLPMEIEEENTFSIRHQDHLPSLDEIVFKYLEYAVSKRGGALDKTAKEIGIDRKTLYKRMKTQTTHAIISHTRC